MARKVLLIDSSLCISCRACQVACKVWNDLPAEPGMQEGRCDLPPRLTGTRYTVVKDYEHQNGSGKISLLFFKDQCRHCQYPICAKVCPLKAIEIKPTGAVVIMGNKCNPSRCRTRPCERACIYQVPKFNQELGKMRKCTLCFNRISDGSGRATACADACPTGAISFGDYSVMVQKAYERLNDLLPKYPNARLYPGQNGPCGNTSVLWILTESLSAYSLLIGR
ncbi:MAG: formate dehydrogenase [bacterium]|nr:formate dehydrogenase [bacterium]